VYSAVARIAEGNFFLAMKQGARLRHVVHVCSRANHRVDETRFGIHADVRLHPEVPLVPLLGLVHLRVARLVLVLRRTWRCDDRRVDDGAGSHQQALLPEVGVDLVKERPRQIVVLQQAPELQQRRGVRHRLPRQIDADGIAQRLAVVDCILERLVGKAIPLLEAVHAQHLRHADRLSSHAPTRRIERLDHPR